MKLLISLFIAALLALFFYLLPQPKPIVAPDTEATNSFVIGPVQLFDGSSWHANHYLEVREGWVMQWHSTAPDLKLPRVDGKGHWLIPGLIDAHVHIIAFSDHLQQNLHFGVSTVLDQFSPIDLLNTQQAQHLNTAFTANADMFGAGLLATVAGGHGTQYGIAIPVLAGPEDAEHFVLARKAEGSNWIKIVYRSEKARKAGQPSLDLASVTALIQAAQQHGLIAVVHIEDQNSALDVVKAGANGLVHGFYDTAVSDELIAAMQANGSFIIPTMVVMEGFLQQQINQQLILENQPEWLTPDIKNNLRQQFNFGAKNPRGYAQLQHNVKRLFDAGIPVLAGTDAPNPNTAPGISMVVEMELLRRAGLPVDAVLQSATGLTGKTFNLPAHGHLKPGAKADFLLLTTNPQDDLTSLWQPTGIWKHGWRQSGIVANKADAMLSGTIADFRHSEQPSQGSFMASDDRIMLGKSFVTLQWQPQQAMQVQGAVKAGFAYPWAGFSWQLAEVMGQGSDLSALQRLRFSIRGTPGQYRLDAFNVGSWMPASQVFTVTGDWQWVTLSLKDFKELDITNVSMLSWIGPNGDFAFEIEQIELN